MDIVDMVNLDEDAVKDILSNKESKLKNLDQREEIYLEELNKGLEAYAIPSSPVSDGMPHGGGSQKDLSDLLLRASKIQSDSIKELCNAIEEIRKKRELINRVWLCYAALPDPYFQILQLLYVEKDKYESAAKTMKKTLDMSRSNFDNKRKQAMEQLICYCKSDLTVADLIRYEKINQTLNKVKKCQKKQIVETNKEYQQMSLLDMVDRKTYDKGQNNG